MTSAPVTAAMTGAPVTAAMSTAVAAGATAATVAAMSATAATVAAVSTTVAAAITPSAVPAAIAAAVTSSAAAAAAPSGPAPVPDTGGAVARTARPAACGCTLASTTVGLVLRVTRSRVRRRWTAAGPRARHGSSFSAPVPRKSRDRRTIARRFTGAGTASVGGPL